MGSISSHIMPLVILIASGADTHTNTYIHVRTETISRNQVHAGHRPARTWFKNHKKLAKISHYLLARLVVQKLIDN